MSSRYENASFSVFTYDPESSLLPKIGNIEYVPYFPKQIRKSPFRNLGYLFQGIRAIRRADLVII